MSSGKTIQLGPNVPGEPLVEILESRTALKSFVQVDQYRIRSRTFGGSMTEPYERDIVSIGPTGKAVVILPYDPVRDVVILVEQLRLPNYLSRRSKGWSLEPVAGLIEIGDEPEDTARRESLEECGREIKRIRKVAHYMPSPGSLNETIYLYVGEVEAGESGNIGGLVHEQEDIRSHVLSFDEALALADSDMIDNAHCLLVLNWLARHREQLRHDWLQD